MICSGVWRLRFMGLLLAKSGRLGSSHKDWFSFWGPRHIHPRQKNKDTGDSQVKEAELFQQIGKLQMELEWLKKNLSCSDARELRKLVDHDHPELSVSRQCALLGLPRSTLYCRPTPVRESTLRIMARIDSL